jgi:error-prone DNA polymerase
LQRHRNRDEEARNQVVVELAREARLPLLASNGVCHAMPAEREIFDVLTAIGIHVTLETAGRLLSNNAERHV